MTAWNAFYLMCAFGVCGFIGGAFWSRSLKNGASRTLGRHSSAEKGYRRRPDDDIDDRTFNTEIKKKFGRDAHYEPHGKKRSLPYWILEVISRLVVGGTYLVATIAGLLIGYQVWVIGATVIAAQFFNYTLGERSLYFGLIGALITSGHFVAHWSHYFYLQAAKRLHRINMGGYGSVFLERGHTLGDMIYALSYLIIRGVIPWVAFGIAGYFGYTVSLPIVPDKQWSLAIAVGIAAGAAVFANSTAYDVIDNMFDVKNLPDPEKHQ